MTSRVYAVGVQGLEPPVPPAALGAGASREERASYGEAMSKYRQQVREFCNSLAAELTGTDGSHSGATCIQIRTAQHSSG